MQKVFVISDMHFGHSKIIEFAKEHRNIDGIYFQDIVEHDERLIANWNKVVSKQDKVFVLGDFCIDKKNIKVAERLNGYKYLIMGNHDHGRIEEYGKYFHRLQGAMEYKGCIMTHVPVHPSQLEKRWLLNIHGHLHHKIIDNWQYVNVSVEQINGTPILFEEAKTRALEKVRSCPEA